MSDSLPQTDRSSQRSGNGRRREDVQNERFARLLSQITQGIVCVDRNWVVTFANDEARYRSRITLTDINVRTLWEIYPHLLGSELEPIYRGVMETGEKATFEYYSERIDGWFNVSVYPTDEGLALFYHDVTDRKGAEFLWGISTRQLRQVLETTTDSVASIDRNWNISFLNRRAKELLSVKGELLGKNLWHEFPFAAQNEETNLNFRRAMEEGIASEFESFFPDPLNRWLSIQCRPFENGIVLFFRDITDRRTADSILKQQQDLLASIQHAALVATWDIDLSTGKVTFGPGSYPIAGHPLAEIPTLESFLKLVVPSYIESIQRAIQQTVATGEMMQVDIQLVSPDGTLVWVENRAQAVLKQGMPVRLRGLSIDITARKRNEEALVASEARYRVLTDLNPQAVWMADAAGNLIYANQFYLDCTGLTPETLGDWAAFVHPAHRARVAEAWAHSLATGDDYDVEARVLRSTDGLVRWWWTRAQPIRDDQGNILHWLGIGIDIDDRKTFAETLQQRQEETERQRVELESIYQTAPIGLSVFDPVEFRYLRINDRQAETIGLPREKILGRPIFELAPLKGLREILEQVAKGHIARNVFLEGELSTHPGEHRYWNVSYSPLRNAHGTVEAIIAVILEITKQKKAEAALIQSEKLAAVGRLASSISHEINNPLEAITNLLYLIALSDQLPDNIRHYVQVAQAELARVCQIATQTLRFHRQAVRATHVSAANLVGAVLDLYHGRLANSNIQIDASYSTESTVLCFENDIRQVLNNLIANAIDAMRQGGCLLVRAHDATSYSAEHLNGRPGIRITIADTGHGISPGVRARIFEPFFTTKDLNGTGLGLWISSGIVNRHHGRLTFRTSQDPRFHGTAFSLFLPRVEIPTPVESYESRS
ncbi:MAG: PAS domain-containing protein [Edaphobacter sp.]